MTEPSKWAAGAANLVMRVLTAAVSALAGGAFVWSGWEGDPADDPARTVMHALTGFVLLLAAIHVAVRGFSEPVPAREPQP